ncbi:hypothetical protein SAMN05444143_101652 [Flavobacterium succinicans]|uniref:Outer membrane protein beta-barrel domain-containing protein n=1 Tax=Flavobacterium succinicans TaxID=29536 RepID=A0A1I4S3H5_9FLAO|nr:hypothetical protein [Flavobacterium succinicans]SFM59076.1 hypothetical protein SAMN05444143_101652 [Flavobacterium succinicans]
MRNFTIYLAALFCLFASKMIGQESFEKRAKEIATRIEKITKEEKAALKEEIEAVNLQLQAGTITKEKADEKKIVLAEARAINIEARVAKEQEQLNELVQLKVDGKIKEDSVRPSVTIYWNDDFDFKNKKKERKFGEKRTTSQFVFAAGLNNLMVDGAMQDKDFKFMGSHFYEWGTTYNTRILKDNNLLHFKYGMSVMYNNLRPTNNRTFVVNGNQTNLEVYSKDLKESRFRNVYLVVPMHLEFDFSGSTMKDDKRQFRTHKAFRFGLGGYAGVNLKSKQKLEYRENDDKFYVKNKSDFNTSNFIYGLSSYIGYKETSLYVKYDLNPLFKNNTVDQNNISMGIRFDFN